MEPFAASRSNDSKKSGVEMASVRYFSAVDAYEGWLRESQTLISSATTYLLVE